MRARGSDYAYVQHFVCLFWVFSSAANKKCNIMFSIQCTNRQKSTPNTQHCCRKYGHAKSVALDKWFKRKEFRRCTVCCTRCIKEVTPTTVRIVSVSIIKSIKIPFHDFDVGLFSSFHFFRSHTQLSVVVSVVNIEISQSFSECIGISHLIIVYHCDSCQLSDKLQISTRARVYTTICLLILFSCWSLSVCVSVWGRAEKRRANHVTAQIMCMRFLYSTRLHKMIASHSLKCMHILNICGTQTQTQPIRI